MNDSAGANQKKLKNRGGGVMSKMSSLLSASYIQKDAKNAHFGYKYASATAVSGKVAEHLQKNDLHIHSCEMGIIPIGEDAKPLMLVRGTSRGAETVTVLAVVKVSITLSDDSGTIYGPYEGLGMGSDRNDKAVMKAETAAWKYAISRACCMSWGDDPEADSSIDRDLDQPPAAEPDVKLRFSASAIKGAIEKAIEASPEQGREVWARAAKDNPDALRYITQNESGWIEEMKAKIQSQEGENAKASSVS